MNRWSKYQPKYNYSFRDLVAGDKNSFVVIPCLPEEKNKTRASLYGIAHKEGIAIATSEVSEGLKVWKKRDVPESSAVDALIAQHGNMKAALEYAIARYEAAERKLNGIK